jgi:MBG domain (YGX type)
LGNTFTFSGTEFTISVGSLVGTDAISSVTLTSAGAAAGAAVGSYPIAPSAAVFGSGLATNYAITYANGTMNVVYSTGTCLGSPGHTILQPINDDGSSVFRQGSTVPAKFRVCDAFGNSIGTPGLVVSFRLVQVTNGTVTYVDEAVDSTTPDSAFRWSSTDQQWIFNISTKNLSKNRTYYYVITLNDGTTIDFHFGLK